VLAGVYTATRE
jgi:hypothetical protein